MPALALRPCAICGAFNCEKHAPNYDAERNSSDLIRKFERSAQWKATSKFFRARNPFCSRCRVNPTQVADHVIKARLYLAQLPSTADEDDMLRAYCDQSNLQPLCKPCHDADKQREEKRRA